MKTQTPAEAGAGGGADGLDIHSISPPRDKRNNGAAYRRARLLAIAALVLAEYRPSAREWRIIRRSATSPHAPSMQLDVLLIEAVAPSNECADPLWHRAMTREASAVTIAAECTRGYFPPTLIEDAAKAFVAVIYGHEVRIKRRPRDRKQEAQAMHHLILKEVGNDG